MKNCEPLLPGPELAIESTPGPGVAELGVELVLEPVAGAARTLPERVAALDHEVRDDAVEHRPVVVGDALLGLAGARVDPLLGAGGEADEVLHGLRGALLLEADDDVALGRDEARVELPAAGDLDLGEGGVRHGPGGYSGERREPCQGVAHGSARSSLDPPGDA